MRGRTRHQLRVPTRAALILPGLCALLWLLGPAGCASPEERRDAKNVADGASGIARSEDASPPDRAEAERLVQEGRALAAQGDYGAAFAAFEQARAADPAYGLAHLEGAIAAQYVGVDDALVRERFEKAAAILENNPRVHYERGAFEESHGDAEAAIALYRRALDLRPGLLQARLALARALLTTGDVPGARETFRQVLEVEPRNLAALLGKADASEKLGDLTGAEAALRAVIEAYPDVAPHRQRLIAFYERTGQAKKAAAETKKLEQLDPKERRKLRQLKPSRRR